MMYRIAIAIFLSLTTALSPLSAAAVETTNKGLYISPIRQETTIAAGKTKTNIVTIANLTDKPMTVNFSVKQFSVTDYAYDYTFRPAENDWVKMSTSQIQLQPNQSKNISYTVSVPPKTSPGGYYYTLFASTDLPGSGLPGTIQATSLLYITVEGKLVRTSVLQNASIPWLVTGNNIPYKFDVKNTGNIHFTAYFFGQLTGLFGAQPEAGTSHLLMPGTVRTISGSIPSPLLPGVYKVTYGYRVDFAQIITTKSSYIIYLPPWSIVALLLIALAGRWLWQQKHKKPTKVS